MTRRWLLGTWEETEFYIDSTVTFILKIIGRLQLLGGDKYKIRYKVSNSWQ